MKMNNIKSHLRFPRIFPNAIPLIGFILSLLVGALIIYFSGFSPIKAYIVLVQSAFGSKNGIARTLIEATPLLLAGLGVAIAFKGNVLSIGAEGQIYMGALGATFVGLFMGDPSPVIGIPLTILLGFLMGAAWGGLAAFLKLRFGANEIIVTLMLNYIAIQIATWLISGPWRDPTNTEPFTKQLASGTHLPNILKGTQLHAGLILALLTMLIVWWTMRNTVFSFQLSVMGSNLQTSEYAGINTTRMVLIAMFISGGLCGLAGVSEVTGLHYRMIQNISPGYGYTAVAIALLGGKNPWAILVAAILFASLDVGVQGIQQNLGIPVSIAQILQGLALLFAIASIMLFKRQSIYEQKRKLSE